MVVKFRNTICPPQPQLSLHRRAALSSDSNGTRSYIARRTQSAVYIVRCLWQHHISRIFYIPHILGKPLAQNFSLLSTFSIKSVMVTGLCNRTVKVLNLCSRLSLTIEYIGRCLSTQSLPFLQLCGCAIKILDYSKGRVHKCNFALDNIPVYQ
jgi:hypothetical protein